MRGTVVFLPDGFVNEVGEELGWLTIAYKTERYKHFMPWYRNTAAGTAHVVGVRATRLNDTTWQLDQDEGQRWFERTVALADEKPIKSIELKPRPAGESRELAEFDDYYDAKEIEEQNPPQTVNDASVSAGKSKGK